MRFYVPLLIALAVLPSRPADACCVEAIWAAAGGEGAMIEAAIPSGVVLEPALV